MENDFRSRGVLVSTAGFVLGSLGLLLSILTAVLGHDTVVALTRKLNTQASSAQSSSPRPRQLVRRLRRVASESSLGDPIPTISVTLHQTGNSISSARFITHTISVASVIPPPSSVSWAPSPAPPRPLSPPQSKEWLTLPPIQTRTKRGRRRLLHRSTSSPQLTSFTAAGIAFAATPSPQPITDNPFSDTDTGGERKKKKDRGSKFCLRKDRLKRDDDWQSIYVNDGGSPNSMAATLSTPFPDDDGEPRRPALRKAKTFGDLLRRIPSSPGPLLSNIEKPEPQKAFAFTSKSKFKSPEKKPAFTLNPTSSRSNLKSKEEGKTRKRTQPYEAPYFWVPPDQVLADSVRSSRTSDRGDCQLCSGFES